jgi:hypothetical protein
MSVTGFKIPDYLAVGKSFQGRLTSLLASSNSSKVSELETKYRDELNATPSNTDKYFFAERDALEDATNTLNPPFTPQVAPSAAEPASKKQPSLSPGFIHVKPPRQGNGAERGTTVVNGDSNSASTSNATSKQTTSPSKKATSNASKTDGRNWWSTFSLNHSHKHKS